MGRAMSLEVWLGDSPAASGGVPVLSLSSHPPFPVCFCCLELLRNAGRTPAERRRIGGAASSVSLVMMNET